MSDRDLEDALRDFAGEGVHRLSNLFFELRQRDIHALPPDVKLALAALEAWGLKAKAVVAGLDPRAEYDLTPFYRTFAPTLRALKEGEDPNAPQVIDDLIPGMRIVVVP